MRRVPRHPIEKCMTSSGVAVCSNAYYTYCEWNVL